MPLLDYTTTKKSSGLIVYIDCEFFIQRTVSYDYIIISLLTPPPLETRFGDKITWIQHREGIGGSKRVKSLIDEFFIIMQKSQRYYVLDIFNINVIMSKGIDVLMY